MSLGQLATIEHGDRHGVGDQRPQRPHEVERKGRAVGSRGVKSSERLRAKQTLSTRAAVPVGLSRPVPPRRSTYAALGRLRLQNPRPRPRHRGFRMRRRVDASSTAIFARPARAPPRWPDVAPAGKAPTPDVPSVLSGVGRDQRADADA